VEITIDMMKKFIKRTNKTPIRLPTDVTLGNTTDGQEIKTKMTTFTLGEVSDFLKKYEVFVEVNSRSGAIPSNIMEQARVNRILQFTPQGLPAWGKAMTRLASLNEQNLKAEDFTPPQQPPPQGGPPPQGAPPVAPSETDRVQINPSAAKEPAMAF
jgi:hypothetical protein